MSNRLFFALLSRGKYKVLTNVSSFAGVLVLLLSWHLVSENFPKFLLPSPLATLQETYETLLSPDFWHNARLTLTRSFISVCVVFLFSNLMAIASSASINMKRVLWPLIIFSLSVPGIIVAFVAVVILGSRGPVGTVVPVLVIAPIVFMMLFPAYTNLSKEFFEVAKVFHIPKHVYVKSIVFPQLAPHLFAALRTSVSDAWKLTILTEVFTLGDGVGSRILHYFNLFSIREVFAWTLSFLAIMMMIEYGIIQRLEKRVTRAQPASRL